MSDRLTLSCREALAGWTAPDAEQQALRVDYLRHLDEQPGGWSRDCAGAHLTASALICTSEPELGLRVLLTLHAKLGRWLQTGGHLETTDRSPAAAALREAREESGLPDLTLDPVPLLLSRHEVPCGPVRPCFHLDVQYLAVAPQAADPVVGAESHDVAWFAFGGLPEVDESVRALVAAARRRIAG